MNLTVSHIRLTDSMRKSLDQIVSFDRSICKFKSISYDDLYGSLTVTGYIEDILNREVMQLDALSVYYGLDNQLVGSLDPEASENAEHEQSE